MQMVPVQNHLWPTCIGKRPDSVWKGIAQDALIMNLNDLLCVGATGPILLSSTIGRNKNLITGEVLSQIINGTEELLEDLRGRSVQKFTLLAEKRQMLATLSERSLWTPL